MESSIVKCNYKASRVDIILATYNGAKYLADQLESILMQTHRNIKVIIRDDGSTDGTQEIINDYSVRYPDLILSITDDTGNVGVIENFNMLLSRTESDYIMFSDQDDIWRCNKIELTLEAMRRAECGNQGKLLPALVFTDLIVTDENLAIVAQSFWRYQHINPDLNSFNRLLMQNVVTGCTVMINRRLFDLAYPVPNEAIMHDWWFAMVASVFGVISPCKDKTIYYRQHGTNVAGASRYDVKYIWGKAFEIMSRRQLQKNHQQANVFLRRYANVLPEQSLLMVESFISLASCVKLSSLHSVFKYRFYNHGIARNVGMIVVYFICYGRRICRST